MRQRQHQKQHSRQRILETAAGQFRREGYSATGISSVMQESQLTNGAFYAHFESKEELLIESASEAARQMRAQWIEGLEDLSPAERVPELLERYVSVEHRDYPEAGCIVPTLGAEVARQSEAVKQGFERQVGITLEALIDDLAALGADEPEQTAWSLLSFGVGAILLSRTVSGAELSDAILETALSQAKFLAASSYE